MTVLDYSQLSAYWRCPARWYETYVRGIRPRRSGQRSDPLALGALVHVGLASVIDNRLSGIDNSGADKPAPPSGGGRTNGETGVPPDALITANVQNVLITEAGRVDPTPETLSLAKALITGWSTQDKILEHAEVIHVEEALHFPLAHSSIKGVAKVDTLVRLHKHVYTHDTVIPPGFYLLEHKTTGLSIPEFKRSWANNMQADFQILAARHNGFEVDGVLVNIMQKPKRYEPKRTCPSCKNKAPWEALHPVEKTETSSSLTCPSCKHNWTSKNPKVSQPVLQFDTVVVNRTETRLQNSHEQISLAALQMQAVEKSGRPEFRWTACQDYHRDCPFLQAHATNQELVHLPHTAYEVDENPTAYIYNE